MSQTAHPSTPSRTPDVLLSRWRALGLLCFPLGSSPAHEPPGLAHGLLRAWAASAPIAEPIRSALSRAGASTEPVQIFPGCWAMNVNAPNDPDQTTVALIMSDTWLKHESFIKVCEAGGYDPRHIAPELAPFVHTNLTSPDRLAQIVRWTREDASAASDQHRVLREFSDKLIQSYEETHVLFRIIRCMTSTGSPLQQLQLVCAQVHQILPFSWLCVKFKDSPRVEAQLRGQLVIAGKPPVAVETFSPEIDALLAEQERDNWTRILLPQDAALASTCNSEVVCDPITYNGSVIGLLLAGNKSGTDPAVASPEIQFIDAVADFLGTFHENAVRFAEQHAMFMGTLRALTAAIDAKDPYTRGHSERVAYLSEAICHALGHSDQRARQARIAALVHDIGKIGVPEAILCKPGRLTDEEFQAIKLHPEIGYRILKDIELLKEILPGVLHHHERWDGRGYPHKLQADNIPSIARIIGIADTFDAMSSSRSYRPALPREHVLAEIAKGAGSQFDPQLAAVFATLDLSGYDALLASQTGAAVLSQAA